ncbi:Uncharacterised protein [Escherichia coli]|nr:Uncharacterised protein [Escherichia coli]
MAQMMKMKSRAVGTVLATGNHRDCHQPGCHGCGCWSCFPAGQHYRDRIGHWLCNLDYVDIRDDGWSLYRLNYWEKAEILGGLVLIGIGVQSSGRTSRLIRTLPEVNIKVRLAVEHFFCCQCCQTSGFARQATASSAIMRRLHHREDASDNTTHHSAVM